MRIQMLSKLLLVAATGGLFVMSSTPALADDTAELGVKGTIVPRACRLDSMAGNRVDFGTITADNSWLPGSYSPIESRNFNIGVTCPSERTVTFTLTDARADSKIDDPVLNNLLGVGATGTDYLFGLGSVVVGDASHKLGAYTIRANARTPAMIGSADATRIIQDGDTWRRAPPFYRADEVVSAALGSGASGWSPSRGRAFAFLVEVRPALSNTVVSQLAERTKLDGQVAITINYQ